MKQSWMDGRWDEGERRGQEWMGEWGEVFTTPSYLIPFVCSGEVLCFITIKILL